MATQASVNPKLSVIVPALLGYDTVLAALDSWDAQSCREQLEILVLCPAPVPAAAPWHVVVVTGSSHLHQARLAGIHQARADYVMLAEDHCLPDESWAQAVLNRLVEGWDAVGPALRAGNLASSWSQASFLLGYGEWMVPEAGAVSVLPGHNVVLRKESLLDLGPALERHLVIGAFLMRYLKRRGLRFYLEDRATMRHFDPNGRKKSVWIFYTVGLGFGALRTNGWPRLGRALYWIAMPLVAARHWSRAFTHFSRAGGEAGQSPICLTVAAVLACAWACGESVGALLGVDRAAQLAGPAEIKPVARGDL